MLLRPIFTYFQHRRGRKMEKIKLLTPTVLAVLMLCVLSFSPVFATDTTKFNLALASNQIQYMIPAGTVFNGSIATTGMVRFWVTAPNGEQIVNLGIIDKTSSFSFVRPTERNLHIQLRKRPAQHNYGNLLLHVQTPNSQTEHPNTPPTFILTIVT